MSAVHQVAESMISRAQVVVIGGVVVGCSVLYHLTKLGYEIHAPQACVRSIYEWLIGATRDLGTIHVGMYALLSMRLEKGFGIWAREFSRDYTAVESGLARFVDYDKGDFIGRDAALRQGDTPPARKLVLLEVASAGPRRCRRRCRVL